MERHAKTVLLFNLIIALFFILSYLNFRIVKIGVLDVVMNLIPSVIIFPIAGVVVLSTLYAVFLFFRKESAVLKIGLLAMVSANIFLTFILPGLKKM